MVTRNSQLFEIFDALAFEQERYQIFQQTESTPVPSSTFLDGRWDGALGEEPTADQWLNQPDYREGYLDGVASRQTRKIRSCSLIFNPQKSAIALFWGFLLGF